ncbi:hypothetical protein [Arthrobacter mobilis]|uniref:Uncharacterized protein n=1 Tax=Arthrobacter mobilis TaxID=2724944 RepID=A0A7X6HDE9_9MICC|nr:hypothetical protein [Arthrobacter mobilis]NKX55078.1 hypothetical protein [Arthrobacter mobilis]
MNVPAPGRRHPGRKLRLQLAAAAVLWLAACGQPGGTGRACTEIAALRGVSLTVAADTAAAVRSVQLRLCQQGRCTTAEPRLFPGSTAVGGQCAPASGPGSADAERPCSATMSPDGTLAGFAEVPALAAGPVQVSAAVTAPDGSRRTYGPLSAEAALAYPNGPQCPGAAPQLALLLGPAGLQPSPAPQAGR